MPDWLVSSTFYGQWLPGDPRGCVTNVRDSLAPVRVEHSESGEDYDTWMEGLWRASEDQLKGAPVVLDLPMAEQLLEQFQETSRHRGWVLQAVSIMFNHSHLLVEAAREFGKKELLRDYKSYGSRRLNERYGPRESGTWWTESGSARVVRRRLAAHFYVCHRQPKPLLIWCAVRGRIAPSESDPANRYPGDYWLERWVARMASPQGEPPA
jgi:REP element-mobilizing transposase RayT